MNAAAPPEINGPDPEILSAAEAVKKKMLTVKYWPDMYQTWFKGALAQGDDGTKEIIKGVSKNMEEFKEKDDVFKRECMKVLMKSDFAALANEQFPEINGAVEKTDGDDKKKKKKPVPKTKWLKVAAVPPRSPEWGDSCCISCKACRSRLKDDVDAAENPIARCERFCNSLSALPLFVDFPLADFWLISRTSCSAFCAGAALSRRAFFLSISMILNRK